MWIPSFCGNSNSSSIIVVYVNCREFGIFLLIYNIIISFFLFSRNTYYYNYLMAITMTDLDVRRLRTTSIKRVLAITVDHGIGNNLICIGMKRTEMVFLLLEFKKRFIYFIARFSSLFLRIDSLSKSTWCASLM